MIKLVASDLDGTIISKNNTICENNLKAMKEISTKGHIPFAICTGKTYPLIKKECPIFNAQYGIFGNGNQIINLQTGEEIYKKFLSKEELEHCIKLAKNDHLHIHLYTDDEIITEKLEYMDLRNYKIKESNHNEELKITIIPSIEEYIQNNQIQVLKCIISSNQSLEYMADKIQEGTDLSVYRIPKYKEYKDYIINKEYEYLDIIPNHTNKSEALKILGDYLNISAKEIMAIGDNVNDMDMIKNSGVGVAVANAYDEIKQVAKYTTNNTVENRSFCRSCL